MDKKKLILGLGAAFVAYKVYSGAYAHENLRALIKSAKTNHYWLSDVPEGLALAIILQESGGVPGATGKAGETGLMQILPGTWSYVTGKYSLPYTGMEYEGYYNVVVGMYFLVDVRDNINGSWFDAIHAYNVGAGGYRQGRRNWAYFFGVLQRWVFI